MHTAIEMTVLLGAIAAGIQLVEAARRHVMGARFERGLRAIPLPVRRD